MTDREKERIAELRGKGEGCGKIAVALGLSVNTVKSYCRRNNITESPVAETAPERKNTTFCENCGKEIKQIYGHKKKRFCCDKCRNLWWNSHLDLVKRKAIYKYRCPGCGKLFEVYGNAHRKYCSHECYIEDRFGGGRRG